MNLPQPSPLGPPKSLSPPDTPSSTLPSPSEPSHFSPSSPNPESLTSTTGRFPHKSQSAFIAHLKATAHRHLSSPALPPADAKSQESTSTYPNATYPIQSPHTTPNGPTHNNMCILNDSLPTGSPPPSSLDWITIVSEGSLYTSTILTPTMARHQRTSSGRHYELTFMPPTSPLAQISTTTNSSPPSPPRTLRRTSFSHPIASSRSVHRVRNSLELPQGSIGGELRIARASLAGGLEESLLAGRMSVGGRKTGDFSAVVGVKGRERVLLAVETMFYEWEGEGIRWGWCPYVGVVNLKNGLPRPDVSTERGQRHSLKMPMGGSLRIPEKGQLQVIINNPNGTPVKFFVLSYDLADMPVGTKTIIRQRGVVRNLQHPVQANIKGTEQVASSHLRHLLQVHVCAAAKGQFYLYRDIRVVFSNRQVYWKEEVRNEVVWPEPRWAPYVRGQDSRRNRYTGERRRNSFGVEREREWRVIEDDDDENGGRRRWEDVVHVPVLEDEEDNSGTR